MLNGQMQAWPLNVHGLLQHAGRWHADTQVVSRLADGSLERKTYFKILSDAARFAHALLAAGVRCGDRIATLAMNSADHVAISYAIPAIGAVHHTLNPRLPTDQLAWIVKHANDKMLFADGALAPVVVKLLEHVRSFKHIVYFSEPSIRHPDAIPITDLVRGHSDSPSWNVVDENAAAGLCYTSGTTGDPKGVLYSHRSNVLHTLISIQPDIYGLSARDVILPIVPMYHANGWGLVFAASAVGAKLVLPGAALDGPSLCSLMCQEEVTFAAGVPTVWLGILEHMIKTGIRLPKLRRAVIGGAAPTSRLLHMFDDLKIPTMHAWGMTELSPLGGSCSSSPKVESLPPATQAEIRLKQGRVPYGIDMRIVGEDGEPLPHDGTAMGSLQVRGAAVVRRYFGSTSDCLDKDGFFATGDIATIDDAGYMKIVDRSKDIIKSGGEWISSVTLENAALSLPSIAAAAVVGVPHEKWGERPLLFAVLSPGEMCTSEQVLAHMEKLVPRWWVPDRVKFVAALPLGATGKVDKKALRSLTESSVARAELLADEEKGAH